MMDNLITSRSAYQIAEYTCFPRFPISEFARIIHIVSGHRLKYTIGNATGYSINVVIARQHFKSRDGNPSRPDDSRGSRPTPLTPRK